MTALSWRLVPTRIVMSGGRTRLLRIDQDTKSEETRKCVSKQINTETRPLEAWATSPSLAEIVRLVCSDLHFRSEKWNGTAGIGVATSRLCNVREDAQVFLAVGGLTLPRLQAQQFGTGGGL